jgi:IS1 family transposase
MPGLIFYKKMILKFAYSANIKPFLEKVAHLPNLICHADDWAAYSRQFPVANKQIVGKDNTRKIERKNLNFRTHIKGLGRKPSVFQRRKIYMPT